MSQSPPNLLVPVCPRKVYPGDSCTVSCTGLDSDICIGQSNVVFVADDLKKDLSKKGFESDKNGFIVKLPNRKLSHPEYCIELTAMCFGCINIVVESMMCVMQVLIKSVINTILFVQTLISYIITGLYNTLSFVVNCWALVPCLIYLFLANNCRFIICNNGIGPCCIYYKIQVIIISLPAMAITWYLLGAVGITDAVMKSAGYEKITAKPPSAFFYLRTSRTSQNVIDYDMETVTTLKYFEEDINMDDFTEQETNFMQFVTADKITPYTEEQANFTETETPDNLKDISIYDTIIEYDYMTEKIQTTEKEESVTKLKHKPPDKYHEKELYSIFQDENPELNNTVASMIDTTHNFEDIAKGFIETTYKFEFETSDKVEETTTKVQKSTAKEEKTTQHIFFKASETSKEQTSETEQTFGIITETDFKVTESEIKVSSYLVEENFITEGMTTSTEFPEAFVVLEESTTKPDVENDKTRSTYISKLKGMSIYDDTESTINYKDMSTSKESTRKFEEITSMPTTTVPTVQSFEEVTESFDNTISEQSTITEVPEEFVMLEESTTKSNFEEESTIVSPKTWIVVDEETNTVKFEEVTFDLGTT